MRRYLFCIFILCAIALGGFLLMSTHCARAQNGSAEYSRGDVAEKARTFRQLLAQRQSEGADVSQARRLGREAKAAYKRGDSETAVRLIDQAIALLQPSGAAGAEPERGSAAAPSGAGEEEGFDEEGGGVEIGQAAPLAQAPMTASPPALQAGKGKVGRGVVLRWAKNPSEYSNPLVSVVQFDVDWAILEPQEGHYNWAELDSRIAEAQGAGKRVAIALWTHSYTGARSTGVPMWCSCKKITGTYSGGKMAEVSKKKTFELTYPVKWDPVYKEKFANFVRALAKRYDDSFEYIQITETALPFQEKYGLPQKWEDMGFTLDVYKKAIQDTIDLFVQQFPRTQIMLGFNQVRGTSDAWLNAHPDDIKWMWDLAAYAASKKVGFMNPGLRAWDNPPQVRYVWQIFKKYQGIVPLGMVINPNAVSQGNMTLSQVVEKGFGIAKVNYLVFPAVWMKRQGGAEAIKLAYEEIKQEKLN